MQSADRVLARRYAQALFQAVAAGGAKAGGPDGEAASPELEKTRQELADAVRAVSGRAASFQHPLLGAARKKALLRESAGPAASPKTLKLMELLIDKKRFGLLPTVAAEFGRLADEARGLVRAQVRAAAELSPAESERLQAALGALSGKRVAVSVSAAPELLGGAVVRMGDWVIDGSIQGRLRRLEKHLSRT